jgi:hypothetical protein
MDRQPMLEFCGFLSLEEAMGARGQLRAEGIRSEVLVREDDPTAPAEEAPKDTFWLRLPAADFEKAVGILGTGAESAPEDETAECSECGEAVSGDETFCPHCGARFEEA